MELVRAYAHLLETRFGPALVVVQTAHGTITKRLTLL
jgi:hypothetical protein